MPTYDLKCESCGLEFEAFCRMDERLKQRCKLCGSKTRILVSAPAVARPDSPWYRTVNGNIDDLEKVRKGRQKRIETREDYREAVNRIYSDPHPRVQEIRWELLERASLGTKIG